jgi:hypothetical protein
MTNELTVDDIEEGQAERGSDGELIAEEHTIPWGDDEKVVKTKPITTGLLNELSHTDEEIRNLDPHAVQEALQMIYLTDAVLSMSVDDIRDLKAPRLNALLSPLEEQIEASIGGQGNGAQEGATAQERRQQRAKEMR